MKTRYLFQKSILRALRALASFLVPAFPERRGSTRVLTGRQQPGTGSVPIGAPRPAIRVEPSSDRFVQRMKRRSFSILFLAVAGLMLAGPGRAQLPVQVKNINPTGSASPQYLTNVDGTLYFSANDGATGNELWKSDGTAAGTVLVKDIFPGSGSSFPQYLTPINGTLYFQATDGINGNELWKSDGTEAGTVLVKDIHPGSGSSFPQHLVNVNGTLYFQAEEGTNGYELWKSDGTEAGTVLVSDLNPSGDSYPNNLTPINGTLYFVADDGTNGYELWKSDGTAAGTVLVKDINPTGSTFFRYLTNVDGTLYFRADDGTNGEELWKSDGTAAGTVLVKDIRPGSNGSFPKELTNLDGTLYFQADDGTNGGELWKSDGTAAGTVLVSDINPTGSSSPQFLTNVDGTLYFRVFPVGVDDELWKLAPFSSLSMPTVTGAPVCAGQAVTLTFTATNPGPLTAQLSDASGSFTSPRSLGAVSPGSQSVTIPAGVPSGSGYRIRVVSANDGPTSEPSAAFSVTGLVGNYTSTPTVSLTPACAGGSIRVSFTVGSRGTCSFPQNNTFSAQLSDAGGSFASPVNLGTVTPGINTLALPQNLPTGSGYRVRIAASADAEVLLTSPSAVFTVNQPAFSSTPSVSGDNKCAGQGVRLSFSVSSCAFFGGNVFSIELSDASGANFASIPGTVTPGALNTVVIPTGTPAGTGYKLRVVSSNPALTSAASANFKVKACGNTREAAPEEAGLRVVVSPNPSTEGRLRISVTGAEGQALRVVLFNGTGQAVREQTLNRAGEEEALEWDISHQSQGLYLLQVSGGKERKTVKVLH